jgi:hypothetical protein
MPLFMVKKDVFEWIRTGQKNLETYMSIERLEQLKSHMGKAFRL